MDHSERTPWATERRQRAAAAEEPAPRPAPQARPSSWIVGTALVTLVLVLVSIGAAVAGLRYLEVTFLALAAAVVGYRVGVLRATGGSPG